MSDWCAARGCPCPVAGRLLRASCPPLARCCLRFAIHGSAGQQRRLPGHGQPLADPRVVQAEGRKASGAPCWTRRWVAVRPTPYGVGLGQEFVPNKPKAVRPRAPHAGRGARWRFAPRLTAWGLDGCVASPSRTSLAARRFQPRRRRKAYIAVARPMPESTIAGGSGTATISMRYG